MSKANRSAERSDAGATRRRSSAKRRQKPASLPL